MIMSEINDQWLSTIKEWELSGLTQAEFCLQKDVKKVTFGYWRNKFIASGEVESRATKSALDSKAVSDFIPFNITSSSIPNEDGGGNGIIEVKLPHGITLRIPVDARSCQ
jgi:hypothetical protein